MKILYWPVMREQVFNQPQMVSDYMSDMLFHGLRTEFGRDVVDINRFWWMYSRDREERPEDFKKIWGKGFTLYGLLPSDSEPSREYDEHALGEHVFDLVICPIHHSAVADKEYIYQRLLYLNRYFRREQIIIVDGHDTIDIDSRFPPLGIYFKRELTDQFNFDGVYPISFAIPEEKILASEFKGNYVHDFAPLVPVNHSWNSEHIRTYTYDDELDYYNMYANSLFGYTCKKAGYDCLRHYEQIALGCLCYFTDIEKCPSLTLHNFPKDLCIAAKKMRGVYPGTISEYNSDIDTYIGTTQQIKLREERGKVIWSEFSWSGYQNLRKRFLDYLKKYLTTKALAHYVLDTVKDVSL